MEEKYKKIMAQIIELIDDNLIEEDGNEFETLQRYLEQDYVDLIDLRNRIKDGTDEDTTLYEEDHITLDHTLDSLETFIGIIRIIRSGLCQKEEN